MSSTKSNRLSINNLDITLDSDVDALFKTANTRTCKTLRTANIYTIKDLIWNIPSVVQTIPEPAPFSHATKGKMFKGKGKVTGIRSNSLFHRKKGPLLVNIAMTVSDSLSKQSFTLKWFNSYPTKLNSLKEIDEIIFWGFPQNKGDNLEFSAPDIVDLAKSDDEKANDIFVKYSQIKGLKSGKVKHLINKIPKSTWDQITDSPSISTLEKRSFIPMKLALKILHGIFDQSEVAHITSDDIFSLAYERLIYEEFYLNQLQFLNKKNENKNLTSHILKVKNLKKIIQQLPYQLTPDQDIVIKEIMADFQKGHPMMRLLQGEVGSGKTTVCLVAAKVALDNNFQVAIMCPTESLARQHYRSFCASGIINPEDIALLVGSLSLKEKKSIQEQISLGIKKFVIGTHSLIQEGVSFERLGLIVIDEQHKFGVDQRNTLIKKGESPHILSMSATPIPRSLGLTYLGDLDISTIKTLPKTRKKIQTKIVDKSNFSQFLSFFKTRLELGEQAYIVVPMIEESEELHNVETAYKIFSKYFPEASISVLHGKIKPDTKEEIFSQFNRGETSILIATSVIEVGINCVNATIMSILDPQRFGLSSLHQLRGRVARGDKPGFCFLVVDKGLTRETKKRLKVIEKTTDGFAIAEEDLKIRGHGEYFGTKQSGTDQSLVLADIQTHMNLLEMAREDVTPTPCGSLEI
jgi:ATP-dependent DNA helicase RecG